MSRPRIIEIAVLAFLGVALLYWTAAGHTGRGYYQVRPDGKTAKLSQTEAQGRLSEIDRQELAAAVKEARPATTRFSWPRTVGIWVSAFFTLAIMSFLYRDNAWYKVAEHTFVGMSAAYWMVYSFWTILVPNLAGKLFPRWVKLTLQPGLDLNQIAQELDLRSWLRWLVDYRWAADHPFQCHWWQLMNAFYWIPAILGIMLLWRLAPKGGWIARWPLAYLIGTTAGLKLVAFLGADFVAQISSTIVPLVQPSYDAQTGGLLWGQTIYLSLNNILVLLGVVCGVLYFFFSVEHRGLVGKASRVGIWVLMITFGAGFGYTVMGRIALLVGRFEFIVGDWLNLVPT